MKHNFIANIKRKNKIVFKRRMKDLGIYFQLQSIEIVSINLFDLFDLKFFPRIKRLKVR